MPPPPVPQAPPALQALPVPQMAPAPQVPTPAAPAPALAPQPSGSLNYPPSVTNGYLQTSMPYYDLAYYHNPMPYYQQAPLQAQEYPLSKPPQQGQLSTPTPPREQPAQTSTSKKSSSLRIKIPKNGTHVEAQDKPLEQQPYSNQPSSALFPPPSALPSQFAYNLPSPSTYYPEFYTQHSGIPSPLYFITTPIAGASFVWPSRKPSVSGSLGGGTGYKPSPLAKR